MLRVALAVGEVLGAAHAGAVAAAEARAIELVALRQAVPRLRRLGRRRPHLSGDEEDEQEEGGRGHATRERHRSALLHPRRRTGPSYSAAATYGGLC